jgi:hypothetical protein
MSIRLTFVSTTLVFGVACPSALAFETLIPDHLIARIDLRGTEGLAARRALQDQQACSRARLEAGFQAVYLRSGVCGGIVRSISEGTLLSPDSTSSYKGGSPMTNDSDASNVSNRSGGADLNALGDINVDGDVVGRDKIVQTINNLADPTLKQTYLKGEITRVESEIDVLETEIDAVTQDLVNKMNPAALDKTSIKPILVGIMIQVVLHRIAPAFFRHASEINRLYDTHKRRSARVEALKVYMKDLKEVLASL